MARTKSDPKIIVKVFTHDGRQITEPHSIPLPAAVEEIYWQNIVQHWNADHPEHPVSRFAGLSPEAQARDIMAMKMAVG